MVSCFGFDWFSSLVAFVRFGFKFFFSLSSAYDFHDTSAVLIALTYIWRKTSKETESSSFATRRPGSQTNKNTHLQRSHKLQHQIPNRRSINSYTRPTELGSQHQLCTVKRENDKSASSSNSRCPKANRKQSEGRTFGLLLPIVDCIVVNREISESERSSDHLVVSDEGLGVENWAKGRTGRKGVVSE